VSTTFGTSDPDVVNRLLAQVTGALQPDPSKPIDPVTTSKALALVREIGPTDALEAMIATLILSTQTAAHDAMRRAARFDEHRGPHQSWLALGLKAARTSAQLIECLNKLRGKGTTQHVVVERVNVEYGGQAVVGAVATSKTGGRRKSAHQSHERGGDETTEFGETVERIE
jgi:hypothetical protein